MKLKPALYKLWEARYQMRKTSPSWSVLAGNLELKEAPAKMLQEGQLGATDGKAFYYNPEKIGELSVERIEGLLATATAKAAALHPYRRGERNKGLWNQATSLAVEPVLNEAGFDMGEEPMIDGRFRVAGEWLAAEQIYAILKRENPEAKEGPDQDKQEGGEGEGDGEAEAKPGDGQGKQGGVGVVDTPLKGKKAEAQAQQWKEAKQESGLEDKQGATARQAGKGTGDPEDLARRSTAGQAPWHEILAAFLQKTEQDYSFKRPERRFVGSDPSLYLPSLHLDSLREIVIGLDTSGSMPRDLVQECMAELAGILEIYHECKLQVFYHTDQVYMHREYSAEQPIKEEPIRSGGTDFKPVFQEVDKRGLTPQVMIMLTDMEGDWGDQPPTYPVVWLSYYKRMSGGRNNPYAERVFGTVIEME